jgi:hypothetical protein
MRQVCFFDKKGLLAMRQKDETGLYRKLAKEIFLGLLEIFFNGYSL